jgi:2-polyprenyl-3-methyl-5-hydroxy-6-metoxy-1,4-benzoquinol methylase
LCLSGPEIPDSNQEEEVTLTNSFRDPGGYVSVGKDRVLRTVLPGGRGNLQAYLDSNAARRLIVSGSLIDTQLLEAAPAEGEIVVEHPRIPFAGYPHEWPPAMLHSAARLTLELCAALLEEGRGLKDATPSNVLFRGPKPVFIDVLSFEQRDPLDAIWLADAQFARTFLIPLLLHRRTGSPTHEFLLARRDGVRPEDAVRQLSSLRRWFPPDLGLVTLPAKAARLASDGLYRPRRAREAGEARFVLGHHFGGLRKKLDALEVRPVVSTWSNYEASCPSYSNEQQAAKRQFMERTLGELRPARVLDVGANTGEFSLMAAAAGASVVAIDSDVESMSTLWRTAAAANADVLPLVVDFARPTPAIGWRCAESASFFGRAEGYFDCAIALAVTHHLMVTDQIPLREIFEAMASLTTRWLVIEYVGPQDAMFRRLARGRDALYQWYGRAAFEAAARVLFDVVNTFQIPSSDRAIYLLQRKS